MGEGKISSCSHTAINSIEKPLLERQVVVMNRSCGENSVLQTQNENNFEFLPVEGRKWKWERRRMGEEAKEPVALPIYSPPSRTWTHLVDLLQVNMWE